VHLAAHGVKSVNRRRKLEALGRQRGRPLVDSAKMGKGKVVEGRVSLGCMELRRKYRQRIKDMRKEKE